jgi:hypothetical protein
MHVACLSLPIAWVALLLVLLFSWLYCKVWVSSAAIQAGLLHQALMLLNSHDDYSGHCWGSWTLAMFVFCNSLDGRRPANLQTALVTWYASASE